MNLDNHPNTTAPRPASRRNSTRGQTISDQSLPFLGNSCPEFGFSLGELELVYDACTVSHNPIPKLKASKLDVPHTRNPEKPPKKLEQKKKPRNPTTTGIRRRQSIRRLKAHEAIGGGTSLDTTWSRSLPQARRRESTRHLKEEPEPREQTLRRSQDAPPRSEKRRISATTGKRTASSSRPRDGRAPRTSRTRTCSEESSVVVWERQQGDVRLSKSKNRTPRTSRTRTGSEDSSVVVWERQQGDIRLSKSNNRPRSRDRPPRTRSSLSKTKSGESRTSVRSVIEGRGRRSSTTGACSSRRLSLRGRSNSRGSPMTRPKQTSGDDASIISWQRHQVSTGRPRPRRRPSGIRQRKK